MVLVEPSAGMRAVSAALNPDCEHIAGDMRTVRLDRRFDAVFVHDAVSYMASAADLRMALETAFVHCRPGGAALFAPDAIRETFRPSTEHGGEDDGTRALRWLEWTWDPDPTDTWCFVDYVYAMRDGDGALRVEHDRCVEGVFPRHTWLQLLSDVGFVDARAIPFEHSDVEPGSLEVFVARRP
jgi:hypothetical protein